MPSAEKLAKKNAYFEKLIDLCVNTPQALIVCVDHVRSKQMQDIRMALRGKAIVVMGKNTQIRKAWKETDARTARAAGSKSSLANESIDQATYDRSFRCSSRGEY